jgi:hypothetical protein
MDISSKKIKSKLHIDLQDETRIIEDGIIHLYNRHFNQKIINIEMVDKINTKYEDIKRNRTDFNYEDYIWGLWRGHKLKYFDDNKDDIFQFKGEKYYYSVLGDVLIDIERPKEECNTINELIHYGNQFHEMMNEEEKVQFKELPGELIVYRGVKWNKQEIDSEYDLITHSWTLDYDVAFKFSDSYVKGDTPNDDDYNRRYKSVIFKYKIEKDSVLSYFTRRNENEILLDMFEIENDNVEIIYPDDI